MKGFHSWVAIAVVLIPASVWADCVGGTRPATAEEREFARKLSESLKAALPAAPAPLYLEREPEVILGRTCQDTPVGGLDGLVMASYTASLNYSDRVQLTVRANYEFPSQKDTVLGAMPKKPAGFKVYNLVMTVDGYNPQYMESVKQAVDRGRLQAMIDQPLPATPAPAAWHVGNAQSTASSSAPATTAAQASDAAPAASPATTTATKAEPDPPQTDVAQKTKDTVNKLRGLLGH